MNCRKCQTVLRKFEVVCPQCDAVNESPLRKVIAFIFLALLGMVIGGAIGHTTGFFNYSSEFVDGDFDLAQRQFFFYSLAGILVGIILASLTGFRQFFHQGVYSRSGYFQFLVFVFTVYFFTSPLIVTTPRGEIKNIRSRRHAFSEQSVALTGWLVGFSNHYHRWDKSADSSVKAFHNIENINPSRAENVLKEHWLILLWPYFSLAALVILFFQNVFVRLTRMLFAVQCFLAVIMVPVYMFVLIWFNENFFTSIMSSTFNFNNQYIIFSVLSFFILFFTGVLQFREEREIVVASK